MGVWGIASDLVPLLVSSAVGSLLTVPTQVEFAVLAACRRPVPPPVCGASTAPFTTVTVGHMTRGDQDTHVVLQAFLAVEFLLTANTLQALALVAFERRFLRAGAGVVLLTDEAGVDSLIGRRAMATHRSNVRD